LLIFEFEFVVAMSGTFHFEVICNCFITLEAIFSRRRVSSLSFLSSQFLFTY